MIESWVSVVYSQGSSVYVHVHHIGSSGIVSESIMKCSHLHQLNKAKSVFPFRKVSRHAHPAMYNVIHGLGVPYDVMCSSGHISVHLWLLKTWLSGYIQDGGHNICPGVSVFQDLYAYFIPILGYTCNSSQGDGVKYTMSEAFVNKEVT